MTQNPITQRAFINPLSSQRRSPRGFTLVELMVTIVIVSILASMIFLFAKRGIQTAKASKCMSNMRQIHAGVLAVTEQGVQTTHNPRRTYPPYAGQQQKPWNKFLWIDLVAEQMGLAELEGGKFIWNTHPKETVFQNPLSRHSFGGEGSDWGVLANSKDETKGSFTQNYEVGGWVGPQTAPDLARVTRTSEVEYPAVTIMFGESNDDLTTGSPTAFWSTDTAPQGNHKNGAHCIFVDGHVELIPNKRLQDKEWLNHYIGISIKPKPRRVRKTLSQPE